MSEHSFLIWADNVFILASDPGIVQRRITDIKEEFAALRLDFSAGSLEFVASAAADPAAQFRSGADRPVLRRGEAMRVGGQR